MVKCKASVNSKVIERMKPKNAKLSVIFESIRKYGPISRSELSCLTGISLPTIEKYVQKLLSSGWVSEGKGKSNLGKKSRCVRLLELSPDFGPALGVEVGTSQMRWVVANLGGKIFEAGVQEVAEGMITRVLESCVRDVLSRLEIKAIGIASAGIVEAEKGVSVHSPHRNDMDGFPLKEFCEKEFNLPVYVDDISRSSAVAECKLGVLKGEKNFIYLFLDEGIGLSWAVDGALYYGPCGISGEIGHFVVDENGPRCGCGNKGCLEAFASCKAIVRDAQEALQNKVFSSLIGREEIVIENILEEALKGDKLCYSLVTEAGKYIGKTVAQVLNLLGISLVVIGGRLSKAGALIVESVERAAKSSSLSLLSERLDVRVSSLGREAGSLGIAIQSLLNVLGTLESGNI